MSRSARIIASSLLVTALVPWGAFAAATATAGAAGAASDSIPAVAAASNGYEFPSARDQFRTWAMNATGPAAIAGNLVGASWRQWVSNEPDEWDADGAGFARRFGTGSLATFTSQTWLSLGSAALGQDADYYRCPRSGFGPRARHALAMTFVARDRHGDMVFSPGKSLSPFAGALLVATTVYPNRYSYTDGLVSGLYGLLINAGWNAAQEFVLRAPPWRSDRGPAP